MSSTYGDIDISNYLSKKILKKIKAVDLGKLLPEAGLKRIDNYLREIVEEEKIIISQKEICRMVREIYEDSFSFGPVSFLISDDRITEIMINNFNEVYIEEDDAIRKTEIIFRDNNHIRNMIDKILSPLGLRVDESSPMVDARLKNGSRINVVLNPITINDVVVTIRKFKKNIMDIESLKKEGMINKKVADFIKVCVESKLNIIVSGATSTGKTTFLNIISNFIQPDERIVTIEETLELNLNLPHIVKLESRPPNLEGKGEITIRDLVRNSLRMRPDRIIVGEIRGAEAVDVLQAMNTGHSGSMTTVHSNSPKDLVTRLETMILMSSLNSNPSTARRMIASSIDMIIHLGKLKNGRRILLEVSELINKNEFIGNNTVLEVKDIFKYRTEDTGINDNEHNESCRGDIVYTGYTPTFMDKIKSRGLNFNYKDENLG
ncbi:MAG: CpaF family protein [Actinomycetia bacterium]|nr:CpaF family protein [Actinomycetota bacterium]MCG2791078.1 CpaF family protein [Actinomycetes bacterium]